MRTAFEGLFKIVLLVVYMLLVSRMKDIRRVFMYHGAEHKTIFCYEAGLPLYQNADGTKTLHLTFFHDQAGVPEYYSQRIYLSIPLPPTGVDTIWMDVNTYDGLVEKRLKL